MERMLSILILFCIITIFLFSWFPNPRISTYGFFPQALGQWVDADANINLRTAIPFLGMGLFSGIWLVFTRQHWLYWVGCGLGFLSIVFVAEVGQLVLPNRHFDWGDVAWGTAGALGGMAIGACLGYLIGRWRPARPTF